MSRFCHSRQSGSNIEIRSDHAPNQLALKGALGQDKGEMLAAIDTAIEAPDKAKLRPVWIRPF